MPSYYFMDKLYIHCLNACQLGGLTNSSTCRACMK